MKENEIKINKIEIINNSFGVYCAEVIPPDSCICHKGDKDFSRFFYVVNGEIIFNKKTERELRVKSGEIVYLPKDITYLSEWDTAEKGKYISLNFILGDSYISLPKDACIVACDKQGVLLEMFENLLDVWNRGEMGYEIEMVSGVYKVVHYIFCEKMYQQIKSKNNVISSR